MVALEAVSMKSGLEGRNNAVGGRVLCLVDGRVSMKSGLEGRNNQDLARVLACEGDWGLNEVRPGRPEQCIPLSVLPDTLTNVSMKSGLEGRNNITFTAELKKRHFRLNEVRPGRPEQLWGF